MKSQFNVDRGSCSTSQQSNDGVSSLAPNRPGQTWQFVNDVQGLLGDEAEPDPLFFVESWTLGVTASVENWQQRRQTETHRGRASSVYREPDSIAASRFVQENALYAEFLASARTAANAERCDSGWSPQSAEDSAKRRQDQAPQEWDTDVEECENIHDTTHPMNQHRACQLLGVTTTSTRKQIKDAYRQKVSQWHPDRLENRTNEVRQLATEHMAAINEAYRLLRNGLF